MFTNQLRTYPSVISFYHSFSICFIFCFVDTFQHKLLGYVKVLDWLTPFIELCTPNCCDLSLDVLVEQQLSMDHVLSCQLLRLCVYSYRIFLFLQLSIQFHPPTPKRNVNIKNFSFTCLIVLYWIEMISSVGTVIYMQI